MGDLFLSGAVFVLVAGMFICLQRIEKLEKENFSLRVEVSALKHSRVDMRV